MFLRSLIKALEKYKVRYAVVGGYAVALHGVVRGTVDIDLVIALNRRSFQQTDKGMRSIHLLPGLPVEPDEVFSFREEYIQNRNMIAWTFVNPDNPLEMVDILITEDVGNIKTGNSHELMKANEISELVQICQLATLASKKLKRLGSSFKNS